MRSFILLTVLFAALCIAQSPHVTLSAPAYYLGTNTVLNTAPGVLLIPTGPLSRNCAAGQLQLNGGYIAVCVSPGVWQATPLTITSLSGTLTFKN